MAAFRIPWYRILSRRQRPPLFWILALLALAFWLFDGGLSSFWRAQKDCQIDSIYDGDTLRATCGRKEVKVRFYCIDAPEMGQRPWGRESRDHLRRLTPNRVRLVEHETDRYGRIVGEVFDGDKSLNLAQVESGQAAVYPQYCDDSRFFKAEKRAKEGRLGIWEKRGLHQRPWEWRQRNH